MTAGAGEETALTATQWTMRAVMSICSPTWSCTQVNSKVIRNAKAARDAVQWSLLVSRVCQITGHCRIVGFIRARTALLYNSTTAGVVKLRVRRFIR